MLLSKQDKSYLSALSRYPLYNQSIYCWNVYIKRMGQIVCMSVVDMKPYNNPIDIIDGVCFTYSVHDRETFDTLKTNIISRKESLKGKSIAVISLSSLQSTPYTVTAEEGKSLARLVNADFREVDLRTYSGLDESFIYLLESIHQSKPLRPYSCVDEWEVLRRRKKRKQSKKPKCILM